MNTLRRAFVVVIAALAALVIAAPMAQADSDAQRIRLHIDLPDGFQPEGIAIGSDPVAYLGSLADGDIYAANLRGGQGRVISQGPGTPSVGMKLDDRGRLFVAGGPAGDGRLIDVHSGAVLATWTFSAAPTFVNDVVLTERAAWFTDSQRARLYGVPIASDGTVGGQRDVIKLPLLNQWDQDQSPGAFNANGIARTPDGDALIVVNSTTGGLYRVNRFNGNTRKVDLGGKTLPNGDGLLLIGRTLYVVQNQLNQVTKVVLDRDGFAGRVGASVSNPDFDFPTTVAAFGQWLFLPSLRFSTPPTPTTPYWVTGIRQF